MQTEKISIIIPVYNVEPFLDRCLESVVKQSFHALEILLVDDGSTDRSGSLCDQWAEKEPRIRVFHQENRGVSEARNLGLCEATGDYIAFVDSDDYIDRDMMRLLYDALIKNNADMSICNMLHVTESGVAIEALNKNLPVKDEVISGKDVIAKFPFENGWHFQHTWNKLTRSRLYSDIRFPKGKICGEDAFIAHRLLGKCTRVACISNACYYYVQRKDSVMHKEKACAYYLHEAEAYLDRAIYSSQLCLSRCAGHAFWRAAMSMPDAWRKLNASPELKNEWGETLHLYRKNFLILKRSCTVKEALQTCFVFLDPGLYHALFRNSFKRRLKNRLFSLTKDNRDAE